ncbi:MAG: peptidyl-prolyl cis-trans isomerase [Campylobacterales bacterium]|nr:peptidyl-prolyl cis-trans isomerase [Campylobacterales bacterium]
MHSLFKQAIVFICIFAHVNANDIIATVNGKSITSEDAKQFLASSNTNLEYSSLTKEQKLAVTERLIERELFAEAAAKAKIEQTPQFANELEKLKKELMINLWIKMQIDSMIISDGEAREIYNSNKAKFIEPSRIKVRHIVVHTKEEANSIIAALKLLKGDMLKRTFIAIATNNSIDVSRERGGDLGELSKEQLGSDVGQIAWNLNAGTISMQPIQSPIGYHVIYVEQKLKPRTIPYEKAKKDIIASLKQKQFNLYLTQLAKEFKRTAKITIPGKTNQNQ